MSNFVKVNKNSDFELLMKNETSGCPFTFTFFIETATGYTSYIASYNGTRYTNCQIKNDGILIRFNNPQLEVGQLKVKKEYDVTSLNYSDGTKNIITIERTNIIISCGVSDATSIIYEGIALDYLNTINEIQSIMNSANTISQILNDVSKAIIPEIGANISDGKAVTLKNSDGDIYYPNTKSELVTDPNGKTTIQNIVENKKFFKGIEEGKTNKSLFTDRFYKWGFFDSIQDIYLNIDHDLNTYDYYLYLTNMSTSGLDANREIRLYKSNHDGTNATQIISLLPDLSTPLNFRKYQNIETNSFVVIDCTKLDNQNYSVSNKSGTNLSEYCFHSSLGEINELTTKVEGLEKSLSKQETVLIGTLDSSNRYVTADGRLVADTSSLVYSSVVYNLSGLKGELICKTHISGNKYVGVCRVEDANGNALNTTVVTNESSEQRININGNANKVYISLKRASTSVPFDISLNSCKLVKDVFVNLQNEILELKEEIENIDVNSDSYEIVIPDKIYAVVGDNLQIYWDSVFNVHNIKNYQIACIGTKGKSYPRYFEYNPQISDVGTSYLEFRLYNVNDCTKGTANLLASKRVTLITKNKVSSSTTKHILCVGDSTTAQGQWVKEVARRFAATDGTPTGIGASNIKFMGRKTTTFGGVQCGWEGMGGWSWSTYTSTSKKSIRLTVNNVVNLNMEDGYTGPDGQRLIIVEINVTNGSGNIRMIYNYDSPNENPLPTSGTLNKYNGSGDGQITYTSSEEETFSPFMNGSTLTFKPYIDKYCGGTLDIAIFHLGINNMFGIKTDLTSTINSIINSAKTLVNKLHSEYPNCKVLIIAPPKCSPLGGMGANYNTSETSIYEVYNRQIFQLQKAYEKWTKEANYNSFMYITNTFGEFDAEYGYPYSNINVNNRVSTFKQMLQSNGVHPSNEGYYMISDSIYRTITGVI